MPIHDNDINLDGFLEGSSGVPYKWSTLKLESDPSDREWNSIEYFQFRAREFISNIEDLNLPSLWALESNTEGQKVRIETNTYPGRHRAKSIYLDFRHFTADKEPSKFERVVNILRRQIDKSNPIQNYLEKLSKEFIKQNEYEININGQNLKTKELINILFNTEYFHAGNESQRTERDILSKAIDDEGVQHLLFWSIVRSVHTIKCLYACLKDLEKNHSKTVNCPDIRIIN